MAIYSLQHKFVSLKQNGANRAAAGVRYVTRSVADHVVYIGFDPNKFVARKQMQAIEDAQHRKDGRIYHLFIGAIPRELSAAEQQHMVNRVAWQMSNGGKAPVIAAIHDQQSHNPHLHLILVDRKVSFSRETVYEERIDKWGRTRRRAKTVHHAELGESVNLLTHNRRQRMERGLDPNATEWARKLWQEVSNDELALAGQDARIDRRTLLEQGIEREAQKHIGIIRDERSAEELAVAANENFVSDKSVVLNDPPPNAPAHELEESPEHAHAHEPEQEQDMANIPDELRKNGLLPADPSLGELEHDQDEIDAAMERNGRIVAGAEPVTVAEKVRAAYQLGKRVEEAQRERLACETAQHWREAADVSHAAAVGAESARQRADERMDEYRRVWGLAGFKVFGWKSPARREAESRQEHLAEAKVAARKSAEVAECDAKQAEHLARTSGINDRIAGYADMTHMERNKALADMQRAEEQIADERQFKLAEITADELYEAYKAGEIELEECRDVAQAKGFDILLEQLEFEQEREQGEGVEM